MDRREALKRTAFMMGGAISAPALMGILNGCQANPTIDWKPEFFTEDQAVIVSQVAEIIIPRTDTPGAKDVGVPGFIDLMLKDIYAQKDQDRFLEGLTAFDNGAKSALGKDFISLDADKQAEYVKKVHTAALEEGAGRNERPFILMIKELTLLGFFTSEAGATQVLQYQAVPGDYKGCLPLQEVGKTWAT